MKFSLIDLLDYYDMCSDPVDRIQIVMPDQDWENPDELSVNSDLLFVVKNWTITEMRCVKSYNGKESVLRVAISPMSRFDHSF